MKQSPNTRKRVKSKCTVFPAKDNRHRRNLSDRELINKVASVNSLLEAEQQGNLVKENSLDSVTINGVRWEE
jgi:hypothetical protein